MNDTLSSRAQKVRNAGYKLTGARMAVLAALEASGGHVTSTEVLDSVEQLDASIGRASVFRTLDLLTRLSIIRPTYIGSSITPTYVLMPDGHHHHIICTACSKVMEFDDCCLGGLQERLETELGVLLSGHLLEFYGLCTDCAALPTPLGDHK